jgi:small-conductance mechanosensitive channel
MSRRPQFPLHGVRRPGRPRFGRCASRIGGWLLLGLLVLPLCAAPRAQAQTQSADGTASTDADKSTKVGSFLDLLADPDVQNWILAHRNAGQDLGTAAALPTSYFAARLVVVRQHLQGIIAMVPRLPAELAKAGAKLLHDTGGLPTILPPFLGFLMLGFAFEGLVILGTRRFRRKPAGGLKRHIRRRLATATLWLALKLAGLVAFALGSIGLFALRSWPPMLEILLFGYFAAFVVLRMALAVANFIVAPEPLDSPGSPRLMIVPMSPLAARFLQRRLPFLLAFPLFGWASVDLLADLGMPEEATDLVGYLFGLGLLIAAIEVVWHRPDMVPDDEREVPSQLTSWLFTIYLIFLLCMFIATAMPLFWLSVVLVAVTLAVSTTRRAVNYWLYAAFGNRRQIEHRSFLAICLERGLQDAFILAGALFLAHVWRIDLAALGQGDDLSTRVLHGALSVVIIGMLADVGWQLLKWAIDRKIDQSAPMEGGDSAESPHQARLRTLLPILRNLLFMLLLSVVALIGLSSMGVDIAPLIATAGVVGLAVGFGSQTLVRDLIGGMFYLVDDAFRVGERIKCGDFEGTVESFSLRSIRLRHYRGPLYTIPFGELGSVQNMSRDWMVAKLVVGVSYDTDLRKVKQIVDQIAKDMQEDPKLRQVILEPLKMQGIEDLGDYSMDIGLKVKLKPGAETSFRRQAFAMIKEAFDSNGIDMPFPTVQVAAGSAASPADEAVAAHQQFATAREQAAS